jgi:WD40 repeat protein
MRRRAQCCIRFLGCVKLASGLMMLQKLHARARSVMKLPDCDVLQDSEPVTALAYSPDGSRIYTASRSLQQRAWDVESAHVLRTWKVCTQQDSFSSLQAVACKEAMQCLKRQKHLGKTCTQHELTHAEIYNTRGHSKTVETHRLQTSATCCKHMQPVCHAARCDWWLTATPCDHHALRLCFCRRATVRPWRTWRWTPPGGCWPAGARTGWCGCGTPTAATAPTSSAATRARPPRGRTGGSGAALSTCAFSARQKCIEAHLLARLRVRCCPPAQGARLHHRRGVVFSVLFHPKQLTVVSGADDAEVRVWDLVDKSCIAVLKVRQTRRDVCHPVAGRHTPSGPTCPCTAHLLHTLPVSATGCCAAFGLSRLPVATGAGCCCHCTGLVTCGSGVARRWPCADRSRVHWQGHFSAVTSLALAPDNWTLLSASRDRTVHMWDLRTHAKIATVPIHEAVEGGRAMAHASFLFIGAD